MSGTNANDVFQAQQSTQDARQQIDQWVPHATSLADAARTLQSHGFRCNPATPSSGDIRAAMLCVYSTPPPPPPAERVTAPPTPVNWFVTLNSQDGSTVSETSIARTPKDLGG